MGLLALTRLMAMNRDLRRRQIEARNGSTYSLVKRKGSPCQQEDNYPSGKRKRSSGPHLPEDIWRHIHSLLPLRDAARAACVSDIFLRSWKCHPNLIFSKETVGWNDDARRKSKTTRGYNSKVDHVLKNHSGIGVKTLGLEFYGPYNANTCYCLSSWLQIAVTPGIEELIFVLSNKNPFSEKASYNFPCSLLSGGIGNSIRYLHLVGCAFRPTVGVGCLRSLTSLHLSFVHITGDELGCLLSNSFALEILELSYCNEITSMKIPGLLQRLSCLKVWYCGLLQVIECEAPNISSFHFDDDKQVQLSLATSMQMKNVHISHSCVLRYARTKLPSSMPNLETLSICSPGEMVTTPMLPSKFLHLKYLIVSFEEWTFSPAYDFFSLFSFLDASPSLEAFTLHAPEAPWKHESIFEDPSHVRWKPGHCPDNLRSVTITCFCSAKILVELTCHILENATSLECLTLDITPDALRCFDSEIDECDRISNCILMEAPKSLLAIRSYIERKVPSTVKLNVLEPCNRCHAAEL